MTDNADEGRIHEHDQNGEADGRGLAPGTGGQVGCGEGGTGEPRKASDSSPCPQGSSNGGTDDLYLRLKILETLKIEPDAQVRLRLVQLLETEGANQAQIAGKEIEGANAQSQAVTDESLRQARQRLLVLSLETFLKSFFEFLDRAFRWAKWAAPATLAIFLVRWMVGLLWAGGHDKEVGVLKDLILVLFGGFLGWGAPRKSDR